MIERALPGWRLSLIAMICLATSTQAQNFCGDTSVGFYYWTASGQVSKTNNCFGGGPE